MLLTDASCPTEPGYMKNMNFWCLQQCTGNPLHSTVDILVLNDNPSTGVLERSQR